MVGPEDQVDDLTPRWSSRIPGVGFLVARAPGQHDRPVVLTVTVYPVALFVLALMLADILTAWLDPRIRTHH